MSSGYVIEEQTRINYAGLFLLSHMHSEQVDYLVELRNDEEVLEPIFKWLHEVGYIEVNEKNCYASTSKGTAVVIAFDHRYQSFLNEYDVFCAVDLESGEFAFSQYGQFDSEDEWQEFLGLDRWEDLRIAVAEYKQIDPTEIVLMTLIREGGFGYDDDGWKYDLILGDIWDNIAETCSNSLKFKTLGYIDGQEIVTAESVMKDILHQGKTLMKEIK